MLNVRRLLTGPAPHTDTLTLPFELRKKSRLRCRLESGVEVGVILPRGTVLRDGDLLEAEDQTVIRVAAAPEELSTATSPDALLLLRAAYHLGNRHVPLEVHVDRLCYQHDHVLDAMVRELGLEITVGPGPFEPEAGAYHGHSHEGAHAHAH